MSINIFYATKLSTILSINKEKLAFDVNDVLLSNISIISNMLHIYNVMRLSSYIN